MRNRASFSLTCLALATQAPFALAQTPAPPTTPTSTLSTTSSLVVVPALVRSKAGEVVFTLKAEDFTLTDDGLPQKLTLQEDAGGEPLALVVVIEADAATRAAGWHPYTHTGPPDRFHGVPIMVEAIVGAAPHRIAVVGFDTHPELELGFTPDMDAVADVIQQLNQGNTGDHGAGILDSLIFAVDLLRKAPPGYRRAILLLSETIDHGSEHSLEDTVRAVTETNTAIYSVAFSTPFHEASEYGHKELPTKAAEMFPKDTSGPPPTPAELLAGKILQSVIFGITLGNPEPQKPGGCMSTDPAKGRVPLGDRLTLAYDCLGQLLPPFALAKMGLIAATGSLRQNTPKTVAHLTGGEYFQFNDAKTLESDLATLANHVPNRYILSFQPQSPHPGLHILGLELKDYPQLKITARSGYWADTPARAPAQR